MKKTIVFIVTLILVQSVLAQENHWRLTFDNGTNIRNITQKTLTGDSLFIIHSKIIEWVPLQSIVKIRIVKKSKFWQGAGIGFLSGVLAAGLFGALTYERSSYSDVAAGIPATAVLLGITTYGMAGSVIGGTIGSFSGKDIVFDLSGRTLEEKKAVIRKILDKNL